MKGGGGARPGCRRMLFLSRARLLPPTADGSAPLKLAPTSPHPASLHVGARAHTCHLALASCFLHL